MTDKELLELAAKACGLTDAEYQDGKGWMDIRYGYSEAIYSDINGGYWNPLTDDGDALRLAVKLEINLQQETLSTDASISSINCGRWSGLSEIECQWAEEPLANDPYAATRRAITRAAAEIGRNTQ